MTESDLLAAYQRLLDSDDAYDLRRGAYDLLRHMRSRQEFRCAVFVAAARQRGVGETLTTVGVVRWGWN